MYSFLDSKLKNSITVTIIIIIQNILDKRTIIIWLHIADVGLNVANACFIEAFIKFKSKRYQLFFVLFKIWLFKLQTIPFQNVNNYFINNQLL